MYNYIFGKIVTVESNYVVVDNGGIGYLIYTANPYAFQIDNEYKIFIYQLVREDELSLYGFKSIEEKELFLKLISVKGLGCKMALPILATGSINGIADAIERENVLYLKKFPKIGDKVARQIILDLKGKLISKTDMSESINNDDLTDALRALGYKINDITKVIKAVPTDIPIEKQIKEALRLLLK